MELSDFEKFKAIHDYIAKKELQNRIDRINPEHIQVKTQLFMGGGDKTAAMVQFVHKLLDDALMELSGLQQLNLHSEVPIPNPKEHEKYISTTIKIGKSKIQENTRQIALALTGKKIKFL